MEPSYPSGNEPHPADVDVMFGRPRERRHVPPLGGASPDLADRQEDQELVDVVSGRPGSQRNAQLPDAAMMAALKGDLDQHVAQVARELRALGEPGNLVAQRIERVLNDIASYTPAAAYATINPIESADVIERSYFARAHWLTFIRNALILLPLLLTWMALGLASFAYQQELAHSPLDVNHPLLELWQRGFTLQGPADAFSFSSFSTVAFVDAGLFVLLIIVGVFADALAMRARTVAHAAQHSLEGVTMQICRYCAESRVSESGFPDMQRWTNEIRRTVGAAAAATQHAAESLKNMSSLAAQFQTNVNTLSASAQTVSTSASGLTNAVAGVSASASAMKSAAESAAAEQKRSADALNAVLTRMDEFAKSSAGSAAEVRKMSSQIITGFRDSSKAMSDAAKTMQNAAERIGGRLPQDDDRPGWFRRFFGGGRRATQASDLDARARMNSYPNPPSSIADPYTMYPPHSGGNTYPSGVAPSVPQTAWPNTYRPMAPDAPPTPESPERTIYLHGQREPSDGPEPFRRG